MLTEQDFLDAGYKKFQQAKETIKMADWGLQKCIRDDLGKRYHITIYVYSYAKYQHRTPGLKDFGFSPEVQFREGELYNTVDVSYHTNDDTKVFEIEQFFADIWETLDCPYYERYEE